MSGRGSVKSRASRLTWPRPPKRVPSRPKRDRATSSSSRPAEALTGIVRSVWKAPAVHRFTRFGSGYNIVNYNSGGVTDFKVTAEDGGVTGSPLTIANVSATSGAGALNYQYGGSWQFSLDDLPAKSDFTSLFDHYEIEQVDLEVDCLQNDMSGGAVVTSAPSITYVPDFDDAGVPSGPGDINQYQRAKTWTFRGSGKPLKFSIKPRVAVPVYNGLSTAYATGAPAMKLDLSASGVPHYGCKFWMTGCTSGAGGSIQEGQCNMRWKVKYHLKFIDPK